MHRLYDPFEDPRRLLEFELEQRGREGCEVTAIRQELKKRQNPSAQEIEALYEAMEQLHPSHSFPYTEPSSWSAIVSERPGPIPVYPLALTDAQLQDRILGAWLGRCVGCLLGKPVEGWVSKEPIEDYLKAAGAYPLDDYIPFVAGVAGAERLASNEAIRGNIRHMVRDDDIDYMIAALRVLERYGPDFTTEDVGAEWLELLLYRQVYTAERVAYRNLVNRIWPPETARFRNPFREWIGAQIRGDAFGYVAPGKSSVASALAYRDARLSHMANGIDGEMFVSALVAAAFVGGDLREAVQGALRCIRSRSRLAEAIRNVLQWCKATNDWQVLYRNIQSLYGRYHWAHVINNAAVVTMAVLLGNGDFEPSIAMAAMSGYDTDCNGATVGSVVGAYVGARALPRKWFGPLNDTLHSAVRGYEICRISELPAERLLRWQGLGRRQPAYERPGDTRFQQTSARSNASC